MLVDERIIKRYDSSAKFDVFSDDNAFCELGFEAVVMIYIEVSAVNKKGVCHLFLKKK